MLGNQDASNTTQSVVIWLNNVWQVHIGCAMQMDCPGA